MSWWRAGPGGSGRRRRRAVRAVDAADFAVLAAQQAGVATGCLDALCARLRLTARDATRES